jgi:hypothetical protein
MFGMRSGYLSEQSFVTFNCLFKVVGPSSQNIQLSGDDGRIMNWQGCGKKRPWPNLRYYIGVFLGRMKETLTDLSG